ncbi:response regulator [Chamaesiphon sp. VAR_48_metabat_403]|uniref:response regulator n=1 Tax=Chamaesiphon sp. VAR_48_metabat_403 TaxID=2964700 RepID=UPI00286DEFA2|nr:response regulator [Chamaesiphon sp. VAR_48_metabat_403]
MAEQHDRILGYFLEEASEHLITIEQGLRKLPETVRQPTMIRELFRAAHSIKGSAAMLGLTDVQKISNQFEANFRLLKENSQIDVDSQLQSLFLQSFGFLRAGIEAVRVASDPYHPHPELGDPIGDPVFEELKAYLQHLLATAESIPAIATNPDRNLPRDPAIEQVFGEYVTRKLDEVIGLCLQPDLPEIRTQIQQICQKLGNLGENFEFLEWTNLFTACRLAIANPDNLLTQLGESISIAVKQAQVLVLADRHQAIGITPDLEAFINKRRSNLDSEVVADDNRLASITGSTWQLDDAGGTSKSMGMTDDTTQKLPDLISINTGKVAAVTSSMPLLSIGTSDRFLEAISMPEAEFDSEAMELNEFMNLLGNDLPSEGTWMQDDDFLDRDIPLMDLSSADTDKFYAQISESFIPASTPDPISELLQVTVSEERSPDLVTYDEETFYDPNLSNIDDRDFPSFLLNPELAATPHQNGYADLDLLDNVDLQLQPDLSPDLDLGDIPAPDFSLDHPMSDLFATAPIPENWAELDNSAEIADEIGLSLGAISDLVGSHALNENRAESIEDLALAIDNSVPDLQAHSDSLLAITDEIYTPVSDELLLENLNIHESSESSDLLLLESLTADDLPASLVDKERINNELSDWIDNSIAEQDLEDLYFFDGDLVGNLSNGNNINLDLDAEPSIEFTVDANELGLGIAGSIDNNVELDADIFDAFGDLDLDAEPSIDFTVDANELGLGIAGSIDNNVELDETMFDSFGDLDPGEGQAIYLMANGNAINADINAESIDRQVAIDETIFDETDPLDFDRVPQAGLIDLELSSFNSDRPLIDLAGSEDLIDLVDLSAVTEPVLDSELDNFADLDFGNNNDSINLDLDIQNFDELAIDPSIDSSSLDLDLNLLDNSEPVGISIFDDAALDLPTELDLIDLNFTPDSSQLDLNIIANDFNSINLGESPTESLDFAGLDINILDEQPLDISGLPSTTNFDDLNFNLDDLSADLADSESLLAGLEVPASDLPELGNLDAFLGLTALGVAGSAIASGSQSSALDDLDALVETSPTSGLDDLDSLLAAPAPVVKPAEVTPERDAKDRRAPKQSRTFEQTMRVSVRHLNNLNNLVGELVVNRNTLEQDQNRMRQFVEKLLSEVQKLNEVGKRMQDLYERSLMENSLVASRQQHKPTTAISSPLINSENLAANDTSIEYDPLEMDRFTPIHLLSQKMIELTVRVRESTADIEFVVDGSTEVTRTLRQITGQLQEDLTKSRMVPFAQTADRLQRGVRDNGLRYGKHVELSVEGRDTLIDKVILESLTEPLIHMVNNAIAHGIESPETRQANGKPGDGNITIRALHQGNQTIISISDDGAGINTEYVKKKAIEKGLITAQQATVMPKTEAYELLFLPGFSTKDQADELAGRGVGMDVVKTSITEIRGTIATESQIGTGTTFTIRLPLALSIAKALIAVNNKSNIAFPMDGIEDTQDVSPEQIQTDSDGRQCIFWRDELMPFKPLSDLLGFNRPLARNNFYSTTEDDSDLVSILILRSDGNFTAVQVDKITGDQEIVIKPLQGPASKPLGIAGATVMGDGRIVPIADVMELIALANGTLSRHVSTQWMAQMSAPTVEIRESMVLIVDDSITVRELLSLTFKRAGYRVEQARDGQEAWDKLRAGLPCDIVFCDIEMPRMDGLEFLSRIQKDPALSKVPVAMLTSRGSDRHRQIASQLGASGYFIKPYLEEALLEAAKRMIGGEVLEIV